MCVLENTTNWVEKLPSVLLGIRTSFKEDLNATTAEMVYGTTLRLPGEFFHNSTDARSNTRIDFLQNLKAVMREIKPVPASNHSKRDTFIHKDLFTVPFVFVRVDLVKKPLQKPYEGPFKVIKREKKHFILEIKGTKKCISIDRLKPAFILNTNSDFTCSEDSSAGMVLRSGRRVHFNLP
jgi:cleavage and polyadenylation specificity factor subunit 1